MGWKRQSKNWSGSSAKPKIALILLIALCALSCKSTRIATARHTNIEKSEGTNDSAVIHIEKTVTPVVVPAVNATLNVTPADLNRLLAGSEFQNKNRNATARAKKEEDGSITITASCDSLVLLLENTRKEAYHFRKENTALKTELNEQKTQVINEPNGWQWFQIWWGRILAAIFAIWLIYKRFKQNFKNR